MPFFSAGLRACGREAAKMPLMVHTKANASLAADLGCSSSYSIGERITALYLLEDRSVEKDSLPTAVEQGLADPKPRAPCPERRT